MDPQRVRRKESMKTRAQVNITVIKRYDGNIIIPALVTDSVIRDHALS